MNITILVDNNTIIDKYLLGEPGFCSFIEHNGKKILFDLGYSDVFIKNSITLGLDIFNIDYIVLSHSHPDHTWGMESYLKILNEKLLFNPDLKRAKLVVHPDIFRELTFNGRDNLGMNIGKCYLDKYFDIIETKEPIELFNGVTFLGEIPLKNDFENMKPIGKKTVNEKKCWDFNRDDSALVLHLEKGQVILTGCSHSGICNIVDRVNTLWNHSEILDIIGGFHLLDEDNLILEKTSKKLVSYGVKKVTPCHCTDLRAKIFLSNYMELKEIGTGSVLKY